MIRLTPEVDRPTGPGSLLAVNAFRLTEQEVNQSAQDRRIWPLTRQKVSLGRMSSTGEADLNLAEIRFSSEDQEFAVLMVGAAPPGADVR